MTSPERSSKSWRAPRCDWNNIGNEQCLYEADIAVAGICANKHVELYAYCNTHHEYWLTFTKPPMHWVCIQCGKLIEEHMSQPYEM